VAHFEQIGGSLWRRFFMKSNYNVKYSGSVKGLFDEPTCYNPRNAIVLTDSNDRTIAFLEICFECNDARTVPYKKGQFGDWCNEKLALLKAFFFEFGIQQGITKH
jgi:hypothetical protein